jgi:hypothetical protein
VGARLGGFAFGHDLSEARVAERLRDVQHATVSSRQVFLGSLGREIGSVGLKSIERRGPDV